jgi:hypothetical protein
LRYERFPKAFFKMLDVHQEAAWRAWIGGSFLTQRTREKSGSRCANSIQPTGNQCRQTITSGGVGSVYSSSTCAARFTSTARWLM